MAENTVWRSAIGSVLERIHREIEEDAPPWWGIRLDGSYEMSDLALELTWQEPCVPRERINYYAARWYRDLYLQLPGKARDEGAPFLDAIRRRLFDLGNDVDEGREPGNVVDCSGRVDWQLAFANYPDGKVLLAICRHRREEASKWGVGVTERFSILIEEAVDRVMSIDTSITWPTLSQLCDVSPQLRITGIERQPHWPHGGGMGNARRSATQRHLRERKRQAEAAQRRAQNETIAATGVMLLTEILAAFENGTPHTCLGAQRRLNFVAFRRELRFRTQLRGYLDLSSRFEDNSVFAELFRGLVKRTYPEKFDIDRRPGNGG